MKVIRFPGAAEDGRDGVAVGEEIDAMLAGEVGGEEAVALRELREDVRAVVAPIDEQFERELQARVAEWALERRGPRWRRLRSRVAAARGRLHGTPGRLAALGGVGVLVAAILAVVALSGSGGGGARELGAVAVSRGPEAAAPHSSTAPPAAGGEAGAQAVVPPATHGAAQGSNASSAAAVAEAPSAAPLSSAPAAPGRLQQLAASVTLAAHGAEGVQEASDAAARLAVSDGGYVESSHVQVHQGGGGASEAQLRLSVPSAKLSQAIAALGRIAPERAVSQESQDITGSYEAAKRRLGDDEAVRRALLRALAAATTEGQIDSLHERLASNREAISRDRSQLHSISHAAASSQLEVTITSGAGASVGSQRSTLGRGLHDAGHVLAVAAAVALVALAVLVPLGLAALVLDALHRAWLRRRREAALEP